MAKRMPRREAPFPTRSALTTVGKWSFGGSVWDSAADPGTMPLLVKDMYEHSYQMDYGTSAAKYVDPFFQNIRWTRS